MNKTKVPLELESSMQNTCTNSAFGDGGGNYNVTQLHQVRNVHADGTDIVSCFRDYLTLGQPCDFIQGHSPPRLTQWWRWT